MSEQVKITMEEWLSQLQDLPPRPEGSFTAKEVAKKCNMTEKRARGKLDYMVSKNKMRKGKFTDSAGKQINYYLPI